MQTYHKPPLRGNGTLLPADTLPLFHWAEARRMWPRPVVVLATRLRLPLPTAAVIAELANIGGHHDA
jgi:hypothetical protein